jgi:uncharacterized protein involved in outer membrane biogenesis
MKKTALLALVALALLGFLGYLLFWPTQILQRAIQQQGQAMTGAEVTVKGITWTREAGLFLVTGLEVANPAGFGKGVAVTVPVIEIEVDPASLDREVIEIRRLVVSGPRIHHAAGQGGSNFEAIEKAVREAVPQAGARRFVVRQLSVRDMRIVVAPAGGTPSETDLLSYYRDDLGKDKSGVTALEIVQVIAAQMRQRVAIAVGIESIRSGIRSLLGD